MARPYSSFIPSIENRESAWHQIRDRAATIQPVQRPPTITISRQYGCEGYPLAQRLKVLLEDTSGQLWNIYDKALVDRVVADEEVSRQMLSHLGDEDHAQDVLKSHFGYLTHDDAYAKLVKHLVQIAAAGGAIIIGRGGAVACQDLPNCFHFRLIGSFAVRAANIARRLELPQAKAEVMVQRQSKLREKFISECLRADITSPHWYDAVFNNDRQNVDDIAQACLAMIMSKWPDKGYFKRGMLQAAETMR